MPENRSQDSECLIKLIRRTAPRCVVACLLALERQDWTPAKASGEAGLREASERLPSMPAKLLDYPPQIPRWKVNFLKKMNLRLSHLTQTFAHCSEDERNRAGFLLAGHLAVMFIPTASYCGHWHLAVSAATAFVDLIAIAISHSARSPSYLASLVTPVMWSLIFTHPSVHGEPTDE